VQLGEDFVKTGLKECVAFVINANFGGHWLPDASADFTFAPKLTESIAVKPFLQMFF